MRHSRFFGLFCFHQKRSLHFFAEAMQYCFVSKINQVQQFFLRKIIQKDGAFVGLLNRRTVISTDDLARIEHPVEITHIRCVPQSDLVVIDVGI